MTKKQKNDDGIKHKGKVKEYGRGASKEKGTGKGKTTKTKGV